MVTTCSAVARRTGFRLHSGRPASTIADLVTIIGFIIVLGAGAGEVLRATGIADALVRGVIRLIGSGSMRAVLVATMLSCLVLVASLGTLAGPVAIAAPILIPVAAGVG